MARAEKGPDAAFPFFSNIFRLTGKVDNIMLLAVFSDSHGNSGPMLRAVRQYRPEHILFLGDGVSDAGAVAAAFPRIPLLILRGNCDWNAADCQESALLELEGVRIFAAHGHRHNVKMDLEGFCNSVCCAGASLGLYGHTHEARITRRDGVTLLNPGSIGSPYAPSCGLVRLHGGDFKCAIKRLERK